MAEKQKRLKNQKNTNNEKIQKKELFPFIKLIEESVAIQKREWEDGPFPFVLFNLRHGINYSIDKLRDKYFTNALEIKNIKRIHKYMIVDNKVNPAFLHDLVCSKSESVRVAIALMGRDIELMRKLGSDISKHVRFQVASNIFTNKETLSMMSYDRCPNVLEKVAFHENTDHIVLDRLAASSIPIVRFQVASNDNTSHLTIRKLLKDKYTLIEYAITQNINSAPEDIAEILERYPKFAKSDFHGSKEYLKLFNEIIDCTIEHEEKLNCGMKMVSSKI